MDVRTAVAGAGCGISTRPSPPVASHTPPRPRIGEDFASMRRGE